MTENHMAEVFSANWKSESSKKRAVGRLFVLELSAGRIHSMSPEDGKTPAIGDHQARELLAAPAEDTIKDKRDRAILSTLLFHALRREELCKLKVKDFRHARRGVLHLNVSGKGDKTRYLPLHPGTHALIHDYLEVAGHGEDENGALFRPIRNNRTGCLDKALTADGVYKLVRQYSGQLGFLIGAHALRATAATNALDHQADIAKVQEWLGHANIATTRIYDHRKTRPEEPDVQGGLLIISNEEENVHRCCRRYTGCASRLGLRPDSPPRRSAGWPRLQ